MPVVFWHDGDAWHAAVDECPHRRVRLSEGRLEGSELPEMQTRWGKWVAWVCLKTWGFDGGGRMDVPLCINVRQLETAFRGTGSTCLCGAKTIFAFFFGAILVPSAGTHR